MSNLDKNFEANKAEFKKKFGIDWSTNHSLYLQYVQLTYTAATAEILNEGLLKVLAGQDAIRETLKAIAQK